MTALKVRGAEVHIVNMQHPVLSQFQIGAQATTWLPVPMAQIIVLCRDKAQLTENHIAISTSIDFPVFAQPAIEPQLVPNKAGLIVLWRLSFNGQHFVQRDDVGVQLTQDLCDPSRTHAPVQTTALVNVIRHHREPFFLAFDLQLFAPVCLHITTSSFIFSLYSRKPEAIINQPLFKKILILNDEITLFLGILEEIHDSNELILGSVDADDVVEGHLGTLFLVVATRLALAHGVLLGRPPEHPDVKANEGRARAEDLNVLFA